MSAETAARPTSAEWRAALRYAARKAGLGGEVDPFVGLRPGAVVFDEAAWQRFEELLLELALSWGPVPGTLPLTLPDHSPAVCGECSGGELRVIVTHGRAILTCPDCAAARHRRKRHGCMCATPADECEGCMVADR